MNIVITGASSGIGYQAALLLSSNPDHSVIAVSRNEAKLASLKSESLKRNPKSKLVTIASDIADENSVSKLVEKVKSECNSVHVLINNAGLLINKPFEMLSLKDWSDVYSTNVFGAVNMIRSLLPLMNAGAHIVNISSMGGFQGSAKFKGLSAYSSSKAALAGVTECLAEELKERKIAVNCLCLGSVETEMFQAAFPSFTASVKPGEMAEYIVQFALEGQKFFNGKIIPVSASTP
jgi:NAD(P)-dependent dehydrogenase (short-subunit alcohol dehydrogenase family)